jgi:hypothetical protein
MRLIVIKQNTDLQGLGSALLKAGSGAASQQAALQRVQALNPHADLGKLSAGTVLLVPDSPYVDTGSTRSLGGDAFDGFAADVAAGLAAVAQRIRAAADAVTADRTAVAAVVKTAAVKRLVDSDAVLAKQLADADARSRLELTQAQDGAKAVDAMQKAAAADLARLGPLLR